VGQLAVLGTRAAGRGESGKEQQRKKNGIIKTKNKLKIKK